MTARGLEREITPDERRFVERLLDELGPRGDTYRPQLDGARIVQKCSCGCPSIHFVSGMSGPTTSCEMVLGDMCAVTADGHNVGLLVFVRGDRLYEIEVVGSSRLGTYPLPAASTVFKEPFAAPPR